MDKKILVAYGSKKGSTAEIAEKIGDTLRRKGSSVDVMDAGTVHDLTPYEKIIIGSSVYMGLWHKNVTRFMKKNIESLEKLPVWIFISGSTGPGDPMEQLDGRLYLNSLRPVIEKIHARDITCFGGKMDPKMLSPFEKWVMKRVEAPEGDFRNWKDIENWAESIRGDS
ncbi:MAG: flavodoxin domain-containing protein [Clostridiales bacterium]|nr:flavodoxin domain-containing protein [Clostridiales bacterium]